MDNRWIYYFRTSSQVYHDSATDGGVENSAALTVAGSESTTNTLANTLFAPRQFQRPGEIYPGRSVRLPIQERHLLLHPQDLSSASIYPAKTPLATTKAFCIENILFVLNCSSRLSFDIYQGITVGFFPLSVI